MALKGIPRDSYRLMSKVTTREGVNPQEKIDELRKLANTDYFDIMLLHWQHAATWPDRHACGGRTAFWKRRRRRPWWDTARRCTACRRCASSRETSGSRSP